MTTPPASKQLTPADFLDLVDKAKLVSIDIVLRTADGAILKGKRKNSPAKDTWFVPGGRIRKGETIAAALQRVLQEELGIDPATLQGVFAGPYDHLYPGENFLDAPGVDTEYVVFGYYASVDRDRVDLATLPQDQHSGWAWINEQDLAVLEVHANSRSYFPLARSVLN